jgi:phenylpyruvate tautomerase PptA (4-oxalocrotonate tautomerase family)
MATNEATLAHLSTIKSAVHTAINNVNRYAGYNGEMTNAAKAALLATVTTVPAALQHADDCAICVAWDGSVA